MLEYIYLKYSVKKKINQGKKILCVWKNYMKFAERQNFFI